MAYTIVCYSDGPPECQLFSKGLVPGLQDAGCRAHFCEPLQGAALRTFIDRAHPDFICFLGVWLPRYDELVAVAREKGIGLIWWGTEDPPAFDLTLTTCARVADIILSPAIECVEQYRAAGKRAGLFPFAANPRWHKPVTPRAEYQLDFIGACSYYPGHDCRQHGMRSIIQPAIDSPYTGFISGNYWDRAGAEQYFTSRDIRRPWLPATEMPAVYSSAKVLLGVQCDDSSMTQTSMRPYEVLACGGFLLTQWTPATADLFRDGVHVVMSSTAEQTRELLDYYLAHPGERQKIAKQGKAFVLANHTYERRVRDVLLPLLRN